MTRQFLRLLILCWVGFVSPINAIEWEDAFWQMHAGGSWHLSASDDSSPSSLGATVASARVIPVFVEGHVRLSIMGRYSFYAPSPSAEIGRRGAQVHSFSGQATVLRRMGQNDRPVWLGAGLGLSARYLVDQYEWQNDGVQWFFAEESNTWETGLDAILRIEKPLGAHWSVNPMLLIPLVGDQPYQWVLEAGYTF